MEDGRFNKKGDKVTFYGVPKFYYPHYINMGEWAEERLEVGKEYTVAKCEVYSSWSAVWLEEFPDYFFNANFFKK